MHKTKTEKVEQELGAQNRPFFESFESGNVYIFSRVEKPLTFEIKKKPSGANKWDGESVVHDGPQQGTARNARFFHVFALTGYYFTRVLDAFGGLR